MDFTLTEQQRASSKRSENLRNRNCRTLRDKLRLTMNQWISPCAVATANSAISG